MEKHLLSNGISVVLEPISSCRSVSFGIWVKTGSRNETIDQNGISHFIEHMLFKGTDRYSAKDIADIFDGIGGNVNAFTTKEYTCFYVKVLDDHLTLAVSVLADMFFHSQLNKNDLEKERNVILEEISMYEDTPDDLVHDLLSRAAYGGHPLGYSILGTETNLNSFTSDHLRQYMEQHYTVEHIVISMAGNIPKQSVELIESHFGFYQNKMESSKLEIPKFHANVLFHKKQTEQNHICLSMPSCSLKDPRLLSMVLLNNTIGGGMSSRLFQEIREKRGLAYSVYSYHSSHIDSGLFTIYTGTAPKQTEEVLKVTMDIIGEISITGITEAELKRGKEQLKGSLILSLESTSSRMNRLGKNELMLGNHHTLDELIAKIESVEMEHIHSLSKEIFTQPFALAMVGQSDQAIQSYRRD